MIPFLCSWRGSLRLALSLSSLPGTNRHPRDVFCEPPHRVCECAHWFWEALLVGLPRVPVWDRMHLRCPALLKTTQLQCNTTFQPLLTLSETSWSKGNPGFCYDQPMFETIYTQYSLTHLTPDPRETNLSRQNISFGSSSFTLKESSQYTFFSHLFYSGLYLHPT